MKRRIFRLILVAGVLATVHPVQARDTKYLLPIKAALEVKDAEEKLDGSVKFYFGNQETPKIAYQARHRRVQSQDQRSGKVRRKGLQLGVSFGDDCLGKARQTVGCQRGRKHRQLLYEKYHVEHDRIRMSRGCSDCGRRPQR